MQNTTPHDVLNTKNYILALRKLILNIEIFSYEIYGEKNLFEIGKWNWIKMQNMTQRDVLNTKNYILAH